MLTNRYNLPRAIVRAVENDPYDRGDADISVTGLISPPHQRLLQEKNKEEIVEDVSERIWSILGQSVHMILERAFPHKDEGAQWVEILKFLAERELDQVVLNALAAVGFTPPRPLTAAEIYATHGSVVEHRLYMDCGGWRVSGQFDVIEEGSLQDFKLTGVMSVLGPLKSDWEQQLNLLRLLAHENGIEVHTLRIVAILRDWSKGRSLSSGYPEVQVSTLDIPMWSLDQARVFMLARVKAHQDASPPICTDEERWKTEDVFAVMKAGRKSAVKLYDRRSDAESHVSQMDKTHSVARRGGGYTRCALYCNVKSFCPAMPQEETT